jgi:hypothetical protein
VLEGRTTEGELVELENVWPSPVRTETSNGVRRNYHFRVSKIHLPTLGTVPEFLNSPGDGRVERLLASWWYSAFLAQMPRSLASNRAALRATLCRLTNIRPGQEGITVLGQAYGQLRYREYALLTGYRQMVDDGT